MLSLMSKIGRGNETVARTGLQAVLPFLEWVTKSWEGGWINQGPMQARSHLLMEKEEIKENELWELPTTEEMVWGKNSKLHSFSEKAQQEYVKAQ